VALCGHMLSEKTRLELTGAASAAVPMYTCSHLSGKASVWSVPEVVCTARS